MVLTFVVIATGKEYLLMAKTLIETIRENFLSNCEIVLFTDLKKENLVSYKMCKIVEIKSLKWPEASALRFDILYAHQYEIPGDVIVYLDADSLIKSKFDIDDLLGEKDRLFFVEHPGYFNRDLIRNVYKRLIKSSWETNRKSWSRVPLSKRRTYVYGAIFGGQRDSFFKMLAILAQETKKDIDRGFFPRSYDESYLNSWYARFGGNLLTPEFAWTSKFKWLSQISKPFIEIFEKDASVIRVKKVLDKN